jgi:hypothetical protein
MTKKFYSVDPLSPSIKTTPSSSVSTIWVDDVDKRRLVDTEDERLSSTLRNVSSLVTGTHGE